MILLSEKLFAENIFITAKNITIDKNDNTSIFENEVVVKTQNKVIQSDYAKYDRLNGYLLLKENITLIDEKNNNFLQILQNIMKMNKFLTPKVIQKLKPKNYTHFKERMFF